MFRLQLRKPPPDVFHDASEFRFLDTPRLFKLSDRDLELVEPDFCHLDDLLEACHHPMTRRLMSVQAKTTRDSITQFLQQCPRGHGSPDPDHDIAPSYTFWMRVRATPLLPVNIAGSISLRLGHNENLDLYLGHIGYHVLPPARGHRYALRACQLLVPLARAHGMSLLWITCNPDNTASRKTIEGLGATLVNTVLVPRDNPLYSQGDRQKCRYRLDL